MKTKINKRDIVIITIAIIAGLILGWIFFHNSGNKKQDKDNHAEHQEQATIWTCSMHPQVKRDKPGLCPICGMELVPLSSLEQEGGNVSPAEIFMSESAIKLADIQTITVKKGIPEKSVSLLGKVKPDERNISELTARFGGRIEELFVNYTGQNVVKGQKLATVYSPELITAQKELLEAIRFKESNPSYYNAVVSKLKLWNLADEQINSIENNMEPILYFEIQSSMTGTVTRRNVALGDYVKEGTALFEVIDLAKVWIMFDAYESDLPWIKTGDNIEFTVESLPGKTFKGYVTYIDPFIDASTRVAKVRVEMPNRDFNLKPEMFVNGILHSQTAGKSDELMIPKSSILWTGKRAIVYVKVPERKIPSFVYREILLGPEAGNFYVVADGLNEGEEIAVNGVFKIDAAAQLEGKSSMMNPPSSDDLPHRTESIKVSSGHDHSTMKMSADIKNDYNDKNDVRTLIQNHEANIQHEDFRVAGNCSMCKSRIEQAALSIDGVNSATWSEETKMLNISFNTAKAELHNIHKVIAKAGHDTEKEKAPYEVYNELPECCKYRRE